MAGIRFLADLDTQEPIQFQNSSGTDAGKIAMSGDDLVLSNAVGDILFGDADSDIYIGDGVNSVDILFEQNGAIRAETGSSVTLTLGSSDTTLSIYAPKITNLSTQSSEATALMINGSNVVGTRELGSNAFNSTTIPTGSLASLDAINNGNWSGTDLSIANGGTGASSASAARTNLGLGTAATSASTDFLSATGSDTMNGTLTINTAAVPFNLIENGHTGTGKYWRIPLDGGNIRFDVDTTNTNGNGTFTSYTDVLLLKANGGVQLGNYGAGILKTDASGNISLDTSTYLTSINNGNWSGTDLSVANGGTGSSTASGARTNLGLGSAATSASTDFVAVGGDTMTGVLNIEYNGIALDIENTANSGADTGIRIRGARNGSAYASNVITAYALFSNYDNNTTPNNYDLAKIGAGMYDSNADTGYLRFETNNGSALTKALDIDKNQNSTFYGTLQATNLSGTNTGDQTLPTLSSLGAAPLASPALTGTPTAPTAGATVNTTQLATTAFVQTAVSNLVDSSPDALNTLNELAAALGDDASFSTTVTNSIATKLSLAGGTMTGNVILNDSVELRLGTSSDFKGFHNGTNTYLRNYTGQFVIENYSDDKDILFRSDDGSGGVTDYIVIDGSTTENVFYKNAALRDSVKATFGNSNDLEIYHNGSNSYIETTSSSAGDFFITAKGTNHDLYLEAADNIYLRPQGNENGIVVEGNAGVTLYYNNGAKLDTTSTGVSISGGLSVSADTVLGNGLTDKAVVHGHLGIGEDDYPKIAYPGKNAQWSGSGSTTGQIVIDLPGTLGNYDMMYMEIDIYNYSAEGGTKLIIGGHNWNSGGNSNTSSAQWYNVNVQVIGALDKPIYFGRRNDGTSERRCIAIGETDSTWSYGTVHVSKVSGASSFYTSAIDWIGDWNIDQTTEDNYFTKNPTTNFNSGTTLETNGNISASNFSGSSSGTNTGDQVLPTANSLGAVTLTGTQTITGNKTFSNTANYFNGHLYYTAYDAAGNHYPHFLDGSSGGGTTVNWRQYYGTSYKTHTWISDASGNMTFTFQGDIDANGGDITADNFSGSSSGTNTGDQDLSSFITSQRAISSTPTNGATTTAISSDWAFDNVKTAVPANAVFTDTVNTFDGAYSSLSSIPSTFAPSAHNHDDRYYTETESDERFLRSDYRANFIRVGYGNGGETRYHKLATITVDGTYDDYNATFEWTTRYASGLAGIHVHSDNDTTADVMGAWYVDWNPNTTSKLTYYGNYIKYTQSGDTVEIWVKTVAWQEFDYIIKDSVTEGTPSITWYTETTTTDTATEPSNLNSFTNNTHSAQGYITSFDITTQTDSKYLRSNADDATTGTLTIGDGSGQARLILKKADNNTADHIEFYNGTTRVGEIGTSDDTWLRINNLTNKNIYTPRYIRADNGFFVDGTAKGINGSGNFIGGTITGASDANVSNWDTAYGWGDHSAAGYGDATQDYVGEQIAAISIPSGNAIIDWTADQGNTNIHSGNYINTTYTVGDGGLTQNNFTNDDHTKLNGIETGATADQTAAQIRTALGTGNGNLVPAAGSTGEFLKHDGTFGTPSYTTNTDTTYTAGSGLDLTSTTFSVEPDLRDGITHVGKDANNYIQFDSTNGRIDFYAGGVFVARMESDGDLHMKGDVIAFSDIF